MLAVHELALARALIEMVDEYAKEHAASSVSTINLRLGQLSAVTRALHVSFDIAARGARCEGATLSIDVVPLTVHCTYCQSDKTPSGPYNFRCPDCGRATPNIVSGREMQLVSIELDQLLPPNTASA